MTGYVGREGPFGLLILERPVPQGMPWVDLSTLPRATDISDLWNEDTLLPRPIRGAFFARLAAGLAAPQVAEAGEPTEPDDIRRKHELEAAATRQPAQWLNAYRSVTGIRWRCCHNLFEDEHSPWCPLIEGDQSLGGGFWG